MPAVRAAQARDGDSDGARQLDELPAAAALHRRSRKSLFPAASVGGTSGGSAPAAPKPSRRRAASAAQEGAPDCGGSGEEHRQASAAAAALRRLSRRSGASSAASAKRLQIVLNEGDQQGAGSEAGEVASRALSSGPGTVRERAAELRRRGVTHVASFLKRLTKRT